MYFETFTAVPVNIEHTSLTPNEQWSKIQAPFKNEILQPVKQDAQGQWFPGRKA